MSAKWSGRCRVTAKLSTEFLSSENLFGSQKSGRFGVRLIVARSSFRLAYNGPGYNFGGAGGDPEASPQAKSRSVEPRLNLVR